MGNKVMKPSTCVVYGVYVDVYILQIWEIVTMGSLSRMN